VPVKIHTVLLAGMGEGEMPVVGDCDVEGVWDGDALVDMDAVPVPLLVAVPVPVGDAVGSDEGDALTVDVVDCDAPVDHDGLADGATLLDKLTEEVIEGALVPLIEGATEGLREMDVVAGADGLVEIEMDGLWDAPVEGDVVGCTDGEVLCVGS
jgi:hypothetical protein